jgi:hypothetical protein
MDIHFAGNSQGDVGREWRRANESLHMVKVGQPDILKSRTTRKTNVSCISCGGTSSGAGLRLSLMPMSLSFLAGGGGAAIRSRNCQRKASPNHP